MRKIEIDEAKLEGWVDTLVAAFDTSDLQEIAAEVVEEMNEELAQQYSDEEEG